MSKQTEFIAKHKDGVIKASYGTGIFPSVKMAQMILESGWGASANARLANNYFGIKKGVGWTGETITLSTPNDAKKTNEFRKYKTSADSVADHTSFLQKNKRYENAGVFKAKTPEEQIQSIAKAGYAEAGDYVPKVLSVIKSNNLKQLDEEAKKYKPEGTKLSDDKTDAKGIIVTAIGVVALYILYIKLTKEK
jgi:flagellum-specific peptidoglycan hydrolase FlgJ